MAHVPYQFYMKLCEFFFTYREYFKILETRGHFFFYNLVLSVVKYLLFVFELSYIFHTFKNMKFPTFSWLFDPFPNPSWLCQPILYLCKALKHFNLIPDFFKSVRTRGNPAYNYFPVPQLSVCPHYGYTISTYLIRTLHWGNQPTWRKVSMVIQYLACWIWYNISSKSNIDKCFKIKHIY